MLARSGVYDFVKVVRVFLRTLRGTFVSGALLEEAARPWREERALFWVRKWVTLGDEAIL